EKNITLNVHPYIEAYIKQGKWFKSKQWKWYFEYKQKIAVQGIESYGFMEYHFFNKDMDEIVI
ncbi:MAG TPA: hypothetical protein VK796_07420, partial [Cytophaga sp.]|nr:hypothetical protein [Cytophaga sp.]